MNDLYEIWLTGIAAEEKMENLAGYHIGFRLLAEGRTDEAIEAFRVSDKYCAERGWILPIQVKWDSEIKRQAMINRMRFDRAS